MKRKLEDWLYKTLGGEWCGNVCPPADMLTWRYNDQGCERVACILNDGFEIGLGSPNEWHTIIRRETAHKLAWFILWHWWAKGEWFGLRRILWYKLLHRRCERNNRIGRMMLGSGKEQP